MAQLSWNNQGENTYEHGVDRVVAYPEGGIGVAWSGVTKIAEKNDASVEGYYLDGLKYVQVPSLGEYSASLDTYNLPSAMNLCLGYAQLSPGLFAANQRRRSFDLVYRTWIGNEENGQAAYKLHLVYNAIASASLGDSSTIKDTPEPATHTLELTTLPAADPAPYTSPTAHLILDSRYVPADVMADVERVLYGTTLLDPRLPPPNELLMLMQSPPYRVQWDGPANSSTSRLVRRTGEVQAVNLATNPGFETASGTVEVYRNHAVNPAQAAGGGTIDSGVWSNAGSTTASWITGAVWSPSGNARRYVWTAESLGAGSTQVSLLETTVRGLTAGTWTVVQYVRYPLGRTPAPPDLTGANPGDVVTSHGSDDLGGGVYRRWARFSLASMAGLAKARIDFWIGGGAHAVGDWVEIGAVDIYPGPHLPSREWFSGGHSPDSDLTSAWLGTANSSMSVLTGAVVATVPSHSPCAAVSSQQWASHGTKSVRVIRRTTADALVQITLALEPGKTYTALLTSRAASAIATVGTCGVQENGGGYRYAAVLIVPGTILNGVQHWRATLTLPVDWHSTTRVNFRTGPNVGDSVWYDDLAIVEGEYTGPWFDGSNMPSNYP